jgi:hypothetical protein
MAVDARDVGGGDPSHAVEDDPIAILMATAGNGDVDLPAATALEILERSGGPVADERIRPTRQDRGAQPPAPTDALVADGVGATEDLTQPSGNEPMLDPPLAKPEVEQLLVPDDALLSRRQIPNFPNWSSFLPTMGRNLDQFVPCGASRLHTRSSVGTG